MIKKLKSKKAVGYIDTAIYTIVLCMVFSVILLYSSILTVVETTKENTQNVLDSFVMQNSIEIYNSVKNGNDYTVKIDEDKFLFSFIYSLSLDKSENVIYALDRNGDVIYSMTVPKVTSTEENTLKLQAEYTMKIPVDFAGKKLFDIVLPQKVTSNYTLK